MAMRDSISKQGSSSTLQYSPVDELEEAEIELIVKKTMTLELKELIVSMCEHPITWEQFPVEEFSNSGETVVMNKIEQKHITMALAEVPELAEMKSILVPKKMPDSTFWKIYFLLIKNKIGHRFTPAVHAYRNDRRYKASKKPILEQIFDRLDTSESWWVRICNLAEPVDPATKEFKLEVRKGIPDIFRQQVWLYITGGADAISKSETHIALLREAYARVFVGETQIDTIKIEYDLLKLFLPKHFKLEEHYLNDLGVEKALRLLWVICKENNEFFEMLPYKPDLVCLLLQFMTDAEVFSTVQVIAKQEKFAMFDYFDWRFFSPAIAELTATHVPDLHPHIEHYIKTNFADVWFQNLFVGYLPEQTLLRVFECFLSEGSKVIFRVGLALLKMFQTHLLKATTTATFNEILLTQAKTLVDATPLFEVAFSIKIKRQEIVKAIRVVRDGFLPNFTGVSNLLNKDQMADLWAWLPETLKLRSPKRVFTTTQDGFNLNTLCQKGEKDQYMLLFVKSSQQRVRDARYHTDAMKVFGVFLSCGFEMSTTYRGSGEMFVFTTYPTMKRFGWTKKDTFFVMRTPDPALYIGGGHGTALYLDNELDVGHSEACSTYDNDPLNGEKDFRCVEVELFTFV